MPKGPVGGPRPFAEPDKELTIYFASDITSEDMKSLRRAVLESHVPPSDG